MSYFFKHLKENLKDGGWILFLFSIGIAILAFFCIIVLFDIWFSFIPYILILGLVFCFPALLALFILAMKGFTKLYYDSPVFTTILTGIAITLLILAIIHWSQDDYRYIVNTTTHTIHDLECYHKPDKENSKKYRSLDSAVADGYYDLCDDCIKFSADDILKFSEKLTNP